MKSIMYIVSIVTIILFSQCQDAGKDISKDVIKATLTVNKTAIVSAQEGDILYVEVNATNTNWDISLPEADKNWCIATKQDEEKIKVIVAANDNIDQRETIITILVEADNSLSQSIRLTQFGILPLIQIEPHIPDIEYSGGTFSITVHSNVAYTVNFDPKNPTWIREIDMPESRADSKVSHEHFFEYDDNETKSQRTVGIIFRQVDGAISQKETITQGFFKETPETPQNTKAPLMGWSSWNTFRVNISEDLIKKTADAMVTKGLKDAGYTYINIDDGYFGKRNQEGQLQYNATKFPNGMKTVADYIHSKGLRAGIYSEAGENTCGSIYDNDTYGIGSGLFGHEEEDCDLFFKQWGYDFIKIDYCGAEGQKLNEKAQYTLIYNAIKGTGREDVRFNVCRWMFPGTWVTEIADSWRISHDIRDNFDNNLGVRDILEQNLYMSAYASPGHFNDMDMMQIGRKTMSVEEEKSHFGLWCIMCSPLLIGCDLRDIPQSTIDIITNNEVIALNQDPLGLQAQVISRNGKRFVLAKQIELAQGKVRAVALFNGESTAAVMRINFKDIQLSEQAEVRDLWAKSNLGTFTGYYEVSVPAHGTVLLRIVGESSFDKTVFEGEDAFLNNYTKIKLGSNARFTVKSGASGGYAIGYLGTSETNWAEFRNVYSSTGGDYELSVYYYSAVNRDLSVFVNGQEHAMTALNSGSWSVAGSKTITVHLNKGNNIIRLANATGDAPDIDKIELKAL